MSPSGLKSLTIGKSVTSIGESAFEGSSVGCALNEPQCGVTIPVETLNIPDSVTYIGNYAFGNFTELKSLTIGDAVIFSTNNLNAFYNTNQLKNSYNKIETASLFI